MGPTQNNREKEIPHLKVATSLQLYASERNAPELQVDRSPRSGDEFHTVHDIFRGGCNTVKTSAVSLSRLSMSTPERINATILWWKERLASPCVKQAYEGLREHPTAIEFSEKPIHNAFAVSQWMRRWSADSSTVRQRGSRH